MSKIQYQRQISIKNKIDNFYDRKRESILDYYRTQVNFYPIFKGLFGLHGLKMCCCNNNVWHVTCNCNNNAVTVLHYNAVADCLSVKIKKDLRFLKLCRLWSGPHHPVPDFHNFWVLVRYGPKLLVLARTFHQNFRPFI